MADVDDEDDFLYGDSGEKTEELRQSHSTEGVAKEAPEADELLKLYGEDSAGNEQVVIGEGIQKDVAMNGDGDEHEEEENGQGNEYEDGNESDDSIEIVINMDEPIQPPSGISQRTNSLLKIQPGKSTGFKDIKAEGIVSASATQRSITAASGGSGSGVDINVIGTYESKNILDIDPETLEDKPWRKPGADITDYFNFGFNEHTWRAYCNKQKNLREDQVIQRRINTYESREEQPENTQGSQPSSAPPPNIMMPPPFEPILQPGIPIGPGGPIPMGPGFQQQSRGRGFPIQAPAKGGGSGRGGMMGRRDRAVEGVIQLVSSDREERLEEEDQGTGMGQMDGFGGMGEDGFGGDGSGFPMDFHGGPPPFGMFPGDMGPPFGFPQEMPMGFNPDFRSAPRQQIRGGSPMMRGATNPMMMRNQWPPSGPGQPMMRPPSGPGVGQGQGGNMDNQRKRGATNIGLPDDDPYKRRR